MGDKNLCKGCNGSGSGDGKDGLCKRCNGSGLG
jgi:hypothetical protein